ncbi:MAG: single-stranded DNA-binding protein [Candidatus Magasanikbacteria bacterium]|nr:single-stranded DNA-binding protein [Candidatus Magasanikbacteria bacterium]
MDLNRVTIIGRLTRDPELRSLPSGKSVAVFSVATGRQWTDQQGQKQKQTEFHNVVAWGRLAETASQYLHKASKVYVEGRIQNREWTAQDGTKRNRTEIVADNFIMLDSRPAGSTGMPLVGATEPGGSSAPPPPPESEEIRVEDIPF